tara:strand:+ start:103 stop:2127 length:2025 start_codon:yes stop_codon:yes gene_type:complete
MENILSVDLSSVTSPIVKETRGTDWIEYGTEEWANLYPQFLIDLYYNSSTHAAIINGTAEMIAGEDIVIDEEGEDENLDRYIKLKNFFYHTNGKETLHEVIKKVSLDFKLQGAFALHIIWNKAKTEIVELYHIPVERVRAGIPNAMGVVDYYYVSADWSDTRENRPTPIQAFNVNDRTGASQLLYSGLYSPNMDVYHTPDYIAANNWAMVDQKVSEYHLNNISNGFSSSFMINFANGVPTQEERLALERSLANKFQGSSNAGKVILTFSDDKTRTPEIVPISVSNADKQYLALQELLVQNILTGHRVTSPMLLGIKSETGLGSNVDELNAAFEVYLNTVVKPFQIHIIKVLAKIFKINNMDLPISFVQAKPITTSFTIEDMRSVMTQDEIREELGLPALEQNQVVDEDEFNKVGMIDGKPVYNTKEEAIANAERLGCSGYHEHEYEGKTVYMACESHDELMNFGKTELTNWINLVGEDISDDWDLVEEEIVDGEHLDFDFETELNNIAKEKLELAETPKNTPNKRSSQDGVNRSYNDFYKVRYVYATDNFLTNKSGTSREFCELMVAAKKLFRKEDLVLKKGNIGVDSNIVNPGFGHDNKPYNIFLYKGGPQCRHFFLRKIFKTSLRNAKSKISDSQLIGYTKAKSEGFTAERNDKLVAIAPQRMKNNGYYNPK